jgi:hypothetical protein
VTVLMEKLAERGALIGVQFGYLSASAFTVLDPSAFGVSYSPVVPSMRSRRSAWPLWRVYSSIMWR